VRVILLKNLFAEKPPPSLYPSRKGREKKEGRLPRRGGRRKYSK